MAGPCGAFGRAVVWVWFDVVVEGGGETEEGGGGEEAVGEVELERRGEGGCIYMTGVGVGRMCI